MSSGLFALLDDVAAIAKVAAASMDDIGAQAVKASGKAAGIVIDDTAVTPRYVVGFAADRELPIVGRIAWGSLKNKLIFLLPGALALSLLAPWAITPLLMLGALYLCFEGYEKLHELLFHHEAHPTEPAVTAAVAASATALEDARVNGAIRTDLILSAEIMAIALASVAQSGLLIQAITLAIVGVVVTVMVYGLVAIIVKADDIGLTLAQGGSPAVRALGRAIVAGMPGLLSLISIVGILAMLWVGGGIIIHGAAQLGWHAPEEAIKQLTTPVALTWPGPGDALAWLMAAFMSGILGVALGWFVERVVHLVRQKG